MVKAADGSATYLYCLVHHRRPPSLRSAPRGLPGTSNVRVLEAGDDLWLVTADAPLNRYGSAPIERGLKDLRWVSACAMSHQGVVEHFSRAATVIPMKLFTLFASDERALAHVRRQRGRLRRLARRIGGRQEWGVRVTWSEDEVRAGRQSSGRAPTGGRGTAFLLRKLELRELVARRRQDAARAADQLYRRLTRLADQSRRQPIAEASGGVRILLDAAFLVPVSRAARFRAAVKRLLPDLTRAGVRATVSGPWPAYTFVAGSR
ncbi:MAG TPA: GvpL/GvpF family gas vesicle protein [Methylomirabilota bacterium]|nr:GvpL/GvpF family gas vesicle protein [Methylomirabilota bacterium]